MTTPSVWVCIPTAWRNHVDKQLQKWRDAGYLIAVLTDGPEQPTVVVPDMSIWFPKYPGVWRSWNILAKAVMAAGADIAVLAGDDMSPDPNRNAQQIAERYFSHFVRGEGVYQPTGDDQGDKIDGKWNSQRICGSPWVGHEWCDRAYLGKGPVDGRFSAFYADELMKEVAEKAGLLIQDPDVTQWHHHWSFRGGFTKQSYHERNQQRWAEDKALFDELRRAGYPGTGFLRG